MNNFFYWMVDIGGTKILLLLIDSSSRVLFRKRINTPQPSNPEAVAGAIAKTIKEAARSESLPAAASPSGIGVCTAGFVDNHLGLVHQSPNLDWHDPVPLGSLIKEEIDCPVQIENDTNAAVVGEVQYGAARGHSNAVYVTLSTGIGGGFYLNGRLYRGTGGFAGEIGHTKAFGKGRPCKCGGTDCLETWASGSALAVSAREMWDEGELNNGHISTAWVFDQADQGNTIAQSILEHAAENIGLGLSNLATLLNPSCIVVGGGVAANRSDFLDKVTCYTMKHAIKPAVEITSFEIVAAALEPEAGIWGMYSLITGRVE